MSVKLSESEVQQLQRILKAYEKNDRFWPKLRWLIVIMALFAITISVYYTWSIQMLAEQFNYVAYGLKQSTFTDFLEGHLQVVTAQTNRHFGAMLFGISGLYLLVFVLLSWRGKSLDIVMTVCLREILSSHLELEDDT